MKITDKGLILRSHYRAKCSLHQPNQLQLPISIISIHNLKSQWLMFLKLIPNEEAFLEIWVQVIFDFLSPPKERPRCLSVIGLVVQKANGV